MQTIVNSKTLIPISFVVVIVSMVLWFGRINADCAYSLSEVKEIKSERKIFYDKLDDINKRLSNIEGYLRNDQFKSRNNEKN